MLAGAKGIIMFSDPADYCAFGVKVGLVDVEKVYVAVSIKVI